MSFASIQEDYLDPDLHLWGDEYPQPRCKCGAFLANEPDRIESGTHEYEGIAGKEIDFYHYCIRTCKRCGIENESDQ